MEYELRGVGPMRRECHGIPERTGSFAVKRREPAGAKTHAGDAEVDAHDSARGTDR